METELISKAKAILAKCFQFTELSIVDSVFVITNCTARRGLSPYFKKDQSFEQVSLDCENLDLVLDGTVWLKSAWMKCICKSK